MKKYDGIYIFAPSAKDNVLDTLIEKMKEEITRLGGAILDIAQEGRKTFARPMQKRDSGVYVRIRFELDPAQVSTLVNRAHLIDELFRLQVLAVDERLEAIIARQNEARRLREAAKAEAAAAAAEAEAAEQAVEG
ncbi:MAG: 30S ribosomal protein S6 [Kiritimatiellia bacterium]